MGDSRWLHLPWESHYFLHWHLNVLTCKIRLLLFSHSVVSVFLWPHGLQHARLPCPSPSPGACPNSCPLSGDAIQPSSVNHFSSCPQIFPSIRVFSNELALCIKWSKYWGFSFSISPSNEYSELILLGWTRLISLLSKGLSRVFSSTTVWKNQFFGVQSSLWSNLNLNLSKISFDFQLMKIPFIYFFKL